MLQHTSFKLPVETLAQLDRLAAWYGPGTSRASVVRQLVAEAARERCPDAPETPAVPPRGAPRGNVNGRKQKR